jgi:hypothetical protein
MAWTLWRNKEPKDADTVGDGTDKNGDDESPLVASKQKLRAEDMEVMDMRMLGAALASMPLPEDELKRLRVLILSMVDDAFSAIASDPVSRRLLEEKADSQLPLGTAFNPRTREGRGKLLVDPLPDGRALVMDFATLKEAVGLNRHGYDTLALLKILVLAMVDEAFIEHARNPAGVRPVA